MFKEKYDVIVVGAVMPALKPLPPLPIWAVKPC
jgi:hypothetical protein